MEILVLVLSFSMAATQDKPVAPAEQYTALLKESVEAGHHCPHGRKAPGRIEAHGLGAAWAGGTGEGLDLRHYDMPARKAAEAKGKVPEKSAWNV